jgi:ParB-like chromosome segregation protein Spo0J
VSGAVEYRLLDQLKPDPSNARTHSAEQIELIANSIRRWGYTNPGLVDEVIRAGNGRYSALELIYAAGEAVYLAPGRDRGGEAIPAGTMPVIDCSGWSDEERRAYALADNQIALDAGWDEDRLRAEIDALTQAGFEIPALGFDEAELQRLFNPPSPGRTDPDELPEDPGFIASVRGDVWILDSRKVTCSRCGKETGRKPARRTARD